MQSSRALTQTRSQKRDSPPFQGCYCGCGIILCNRVDFKNHVKALHKPYFIEGSSHYLTHLTQIVLPVNYWNIEMMKKDPVIQETKVKVEDSVETHAQLDEKMETYNQKGRRGRKPKAGTQRMTKINKEKEQIQRPQIRKGGRKSQVNLSQKLLQWNGFVIKPKSVREDGLYYCGKCQQTFKDLDEFVPHSFEVCQQIDHQDSSHAITLMENRFKGKIIDNQTTTTQKKTKNKKIQKNTFNIREADIVPEKKDTFNFLIQEMTIKTFSCGCGKSIHSSINLPPALIQHLLYAHQQIIPDNSSHILLQKQAKNAGKLRLLSVDEPDHGKLWFCPCRPNTIMNKDNFVNHIRYIHKGISPVYKAEHFFIIE